MSDIDFEALVRHSVDIVAIIDRDTRLRYANPSAERILGIEVGQQIGRAMANLVHPDDLPMVTDRLAAIAAGAPSGTPITFRAARADGDWRVLQFVGSSRLDDPRISGVVLNGRDITEQQRLADALEHSIQRTITTLGSVVEVRDRYTAGHQSRVAELASALTHRLGIDADTATGIEIAALLHDIGKIAVPAEILTKPGEISAAERAVIRDHPQVGHDILLDIEFPWPVARMGLEHHERIDGSGYPNHLTGDDVVVGSKILAVADVVEAMSAHRAYRASSSVGEALAEIEQGAGTRYDNDVVHACLDMFEQGFAFSPATPAQSWPAMAPE